MRWISKLAIAACLELSVGCGAEPHATPKIRLFAAASLTPVVEQLVEDWPSESAELQPNFAASSTLARQIAAGAQADVFLSAHTEWIEWLDARGLIEPESIRDIARGELVWIVRADAARTEPFAIGSAQDLASQFDGHLALGDPTHVPVGRYAVQALRSLHAWTAIQARVIATLDAPSALRLVELGEADAAIVYASDAHLSNQVVVRARLPHELCQPILYQAALVRGASQASHLFLDQLSSESSAHSFQAFGFLPVAP